MLYYVFFRDINIHKTFATLVNQLRFYQCIYIVSIKNTIS